jgi:hypothetical protein
MWCPKQWEQTLNRLTQYLVEQFFVSHTGVKYYKQQRLKRPLHAVVHLCDSLKKRGLQEQVKAVEWLASYLSVD